MTLPVFAHRGASLQVFENTEKAFNAAYEAQAGGIELDVQLTKDGVAVIFHDVDLLRLTGKKGRITDITYAVLRQLKVGKRFRKWCGHRILTFEEVVRWANAHDMPLNVELKETFSGQPVAIAKLLQNVTLPVGSHVSSFHVDVLAYVKHVRPDVQTAYIVTKKFDWSHMMYYPFVDVIHAHKRLYKKANLQACIEANRACRFYSIDGTEAFLKKPHEAVVGWIADDVVAVKRAQ
ncbi:MAG: glycerophosphodiester phosphodiesterase family protein [Caryophanon sp.]|nr:glycerophosphodiester phosphodiesterase family protein [Caryophanon sp.]